ncbi:MAG: DUF1343 domain-containing protein [Candidatus Sericytochromatia bacterium]|nr:DUF1343 domain-containing protein [Candidatus Sericytochromatia bacterium]
MAMLLKTCLSATLLAVSLAPLSAIAQGPVRLGIDRFAADPPGWAQGKRCAVLTNDGAIDANGLGVADRLAITPQIKVVSFFAPEHGLAADRQGNIGDEQRRGIPIYSLYGERKAPTTAQLQGVDMLICDMPDVGARFYTFASTMSLAMKAAKKANRRFVVLDRPNPINGAAVEGPILETPLFSFVGLYPIPIRHGMTMGEMARLFNDSHGIGCDLQVITMSGWQRTMWHDQTGLPWGRPSPAMKSLASAIVYPGMCLFEATNVDCRVGNEAFTTVAAPWLDAPGVAAALQKAAVPGVSFSATKWPQGPGITLTVTDRQAFQPVQAAWSVLAAIQHRHPTELKIVAKGFDRMNGDSRARTQLLAGAPVSSFGGTQDSPVYKQFLKQRQAALLYP